ncbi:serine proteinase stubble isoform X2 [Plodia interpunctella]|uniref:serine proteinase stubble isoform X2 n=1 Tax=Plodia interpunctella TaxID=58824 RepID=UPI00236883D2|nr:serine proteinase stubble isoform X2 [Plodia interpunctella]
MGPPISTWPYSQPIDVKCGDSASDTNINKKCLLNKFVDSFRLVCLNFTFALLVFQVLLNLNYVKAGPVILNMDYLQGPVPLARNIRHLPCISRRTGQEGLCMFAIDCLKANGSHLGTCIDRFYFGSCCQIPDKTILPQIIGNNIEDNTIDSGSFVHPQTEDKVQSTVTKIPDIFPTRKITTEKTTVADKVQDRTESDEFKTTLDEKDDGKLTTVAIVDTTIKPQVNKTPDVSTELPIKLSTFQTVSGDISNTVTEETKTETTEAPKITTSTTTTVKPTRRPTKPTIKPFRPANFTRPPYLSTTSKPKPTKPVLVFNITRKPPYRPPPKRPTTKKPLPLPPRLNITILPQSTSTRPIFTRPSVPSITYINTTSTEDITTTSSTTPSTTTVTSTTISTTLSTEKITEPTTSTTTTTTTTTTTPSTTTTTSTTTESPTETTEALTETTERLTSELSSEVPKLTTIQEVATEKATLMPAIEAESPTTPILTSSSSPAPSVSTTTVITTDFPPLVTWSTVDGATKAPENGTTVSDENWSPITPPEGWVLISTIPPTPVTSTTPSSTSTLTTKTTTTTTTTTTTQPPTTVAETVPIYQDITETTLQTDVPTPPETTTTEKISKTTTTTTERIETTQPMLEFTVNVTLSPTAPTLTSTMAPTTNSTEEQNTTEITTVVPELTTVDAMESEIFSNETSAANYGKDDYKKVCGRRFWPAARIVGGTKSGFGQWPWQISLRQYRTSTYLHKCGAALLNENWAITAAHCVEHVPPSELLVRLGEHDLANEDEPYGYAERRVQIIASHPHFDPATFEYDLALLRFYEPVKFQPNIIPICIPDDDDYYVGKTAHVTGWGRLYDEGPLPSVLQEVQVPVINNSACEAMYQAAGYNEHIPNIFICAGRQKGGADSCEGDSGGPMVIQRPKDNRFVLSGVISWGIGCAEPNQPGVYTRISEFKDWINQILMF